MQEEGLRLKLSCTMKNCEHMNFLFMNLVKQSVTLDEEFAHERVIQLRDDSSPFR